MARRREHRGSFKCEGSDGGTYAVEYYGNVIVTMDHDGATEKEGLRELLCNVRPIITSTRATIKRSWELN